MNIYSQGGFDGAIIEDYHGPAEEIPEILKQWRKIPNNKLVVGVNCLNSYMKSFKTAYENDAQFIQIDSINPKDISLHMYEQTRKFYDNIAVFGGINFKYKTQESGKELEKLLKSSQTRCEAIVTTGKGTGIETPIEQLQTFRSLVGDFPLIVGAGVNKDNVAEKLEFANGIIIGSYLKNGNTLNKVDSNRVKDIARYGKIY